MNLLLHEIGHMVEIEVNGICEKKKRFLGVNHIYSVCYNMENLSQSLDHLVDMTIYFPISSHTLMVVSSIILMSVPN